MAARIVLDPVALKELLAGPTGPVYRNLVTRCVRVTAAAKRGCPVATGRLRNSIRYEVRLEGGKPVGYVGSDVTYAAAVHDGTKAHDILPVKGRLLVFTGADGNRVFVTAVHHPGTKGKPFLRDALREAL